MSERPVDVLGESEEQFRLFVTATSESVYRMSPDWSEMRFLEGKRFLADLRDPTRTWLDRYIPDEDRAHVRAAIAEAIRSKTTFELEHRVIRTDGTVGWVFSRAIPFLGRDGEIVEWFGAAADITDRKRIEANLAFLAEISQDLAGLKNIESTLDRIGAKVGAYFDTAICGFSEVDARGEFEAVGHEWARDDAAHPKSEHRIEEFFTAEFRRASRGSDPWIVRDPARDHRVHGDRIASLGIAAVTCVPLVRDGAWRFALYLADRRSRDWREDEILVLRELTERVWARVERARAEEALAAEAFGLARLHEASNRLWSTSDLQAGLEEILDATIAALGADMGNMQLRSPETGQLRIVAQRGFAPSFLEFFREVSAEDDSACARALRWGRPVAIEDVRLDAEFAPLRDVALAAGFLAVHSAPMIDHAGQTVGVVSVHFRAPHRLSERDMRRFDLYVRQALDFIERQNIEAALRVSLGESDTLLRELQHRVKNNLQVIGSLLEMQSRRTGEAGTRASLAEARDRVTAIATIHEMLYQSAPFSEVDLGKYARRLVAQIMAAYPSGSRIEWQVEGEGSFFDLERAVPFGVLLNELVSNVCKHAFPADAKGKLSVTLQRENGDLHLRVRDTGVGLPRDFEDQSPKTLGVELVHLLAGQLGGAAAFTSDHGTQVDVQIPVGGRYELTQRPDKKRRRGPGTGPFG